MSKPDGTVVMLRVPRRRPLQLTGTPALKPRSTVATREEIAPHGQVAPRGRIPLHGSQAARPAPPPATSSDAPRDTRTTSTISHPLRGRSTIEAETTLPPAVRRSLGIGTLPEAPVVAGDDPAAWLTGRAWAPGGEDDDDGRYLSDNYDGDFVVLEEGPGWSGPTEDPPPIGNEDEPGFNAKTIARWTTVPFQTLDEDPLYVGVMAFHMNGIDYVEFSLNDGPWVKVEEAIPNPDTYLTEYSAKVDPEYVRPGMLEVRARVYPIGAGRPRVLDGDIYADQGRTGEHSMFAIRAPDDWPGDKAIYVSQSGSDSNPGSKAEPIQTITEALNRIKTLGNGTIYLSAGRHDGPDRGYGSLQINNQRWITIEPDPALNLKLGDVVVEMPDYLPLRAGAALVHWRKVAFDFATIAQFYYAPDDRLWFENCEWYDSLGWDHLAKRPSPTRGNYYFTGGHVHDMLYATTDADLVRGVRVERISGDAFQNCRFVAGCVVDNINGEVLEHHTDLYQMWGPMDNVIVADILATNLVATQSIFLEPTWSSADGNPRHTLTNAAFVRIRAYNAPTYRNGIPWGGPPNSQLISSFDHVLFESVDLPNQRWLIRNDKDDNQWWEATNVFVRDSLLFWASYDDYTDGSTPAGCTFEALRRSNGDDTY